MKKVALIISHTGSGSNDLCDILDINSRVQVYRTGMIYNHPILLESIVQSPHKMNNSSAVWVDELLYNILFTSKSLYNCCKFIYVIREALPTLNIIAEKNTLPQNIRYYTYRLRRIYEMARETPGAVLLTWDDIATGRGFKVIEEYLNLKEPLLVKDLSSPKVHLNNKSIKEAQASYERYYYLLRNLPLKMFKFEG